MSDYKASPVIVKSRPHGKLVTVHEGHWRYDARITSKRAYITAAPANSLTGIPSRISVRFRQRNLIIFGALYDIVMLSLIFVAPPLVFLIMCARFIFPTILPPRLRGDEKGIDYTTLGKGNSRIGYTSHRIVMNVLKAFPRTIVYMADEGDVNTFFSVVPLLSVALDISKEVGGETRGQFIADCDKALSTLSRQPDERASSIEAVTRFVSYAMMAMSEEILEIKRNQQD